jgi:hypothetical protein
MRGLGLIRMENWLPVPDFDGYEVSDLGRIRSVDRWITHSDGRHRFYPGQILRAPPANTGYPRVQVKRLGRGFLVHQAVLWAFKGPCPEGQEACHDDDDPGNPALSNLSWGTRSKNQLDRVRNGPHPNRPRNKVVVPEWPD